MYLNKLSISEAHEGLAKKDFSSLELTKACFDCIRDKDEDLNAFITLLEDQACEQAVKVDKKIKLKNKINVLEGLPVAIKDNILVEGTKATAGSKILANYIATYDATVVSKLKKQGSIIIGKTNLDEFAMGSSGETSHFGVTKNPLNLEKVSGGSSSGSTVSVASSETVFALGSDTGGSIRQPAGFCGVVGFKPTYGRVSRYGLMAMASSFDQIGPITKNVRDSAIVFENLAGLDKFDSTTVDKKADVVQYLENDIKGLRIGMPKEYFVEGIDNEVEKLIRSSIKKLEKLGAEIVEISLPKTKYALPAYYILMPAEVSSNMARYDGIRYGFRAEAGNLLETYLKSRSQGFGNEIKRRIMLGTYVLSAGYYEAYYKKAQQVRNLIKQDFDTAFSKVDVIATPTSPTTAFDLGSKLDDPMTMYLADIFTVSANVAGVPAISIPCGKVNKMPVGLQFIGKHFDEKTLLNVAFQAEQRLS